MKIRTVLWGLGIVAAICWISWGLTVVNTNPEQGGQPALLSFYISLYVALVSTLAVVGFFARRYFGGNELRYGYLLASFRQAFIIAAVLVIALLLQSVQLLAWWDILLLVAVALLLELYIRSNAGTRGI